MQICTVELVFHGNVEWNMYFEGMHPVQVATYSSLIFHYSIHSIILLWLLHRVMEVVNGQLTKLWFFPASASVQGRLHVGFGWLWAYLALSRQEAKQVLLC